MTGHDEEFVDQEVRDLLADLTVTEPVPDDVADRLDDTIAGLVAEREHRPRRTWWVAAAAAAVVVVAGGVALPQLLTEESSRVSTADDAAGRQLEPPPRSTSGDADVPVALTSTGLAEQVRAYVSTSDWKRFGRGSTAADAVPETGGLARTTGLVCSWNGAGTLVPTTLDGNPATLVVRRARGTALVVTCEEGPSRVAETVRLD